MQSVDVIVVGAGIGGLCAAKTYKELSPDANILILESVNTSAVYQDGLGANSAQRATVGGVWAKQNLYEGIKTNNLVGTYEYSDFPLLGNDKYGVDEGKHIPGRVMYQYLKDYAVHFDIYKLIQFHVTVV